MNPLTSLLGFRNETARERETEKNTMKLVWPAGGKNATNAERRYPFLWTCGKDKQSLQITRLVKQKRTKYGKNGRIFSLPNMVWWESSSHVHKSAEREYDKTKKQDQELFSFTFSNSFNSSQWKYSEKKRSRKQRMGIIIQTAKKWDISFELVIAADRFKTTSLYRNWAVQRWFPLS